MQVNTRFLKPQLNGSLFLPTIEAVNDSLAFMIDHPLKIVKDEKQFPVPWMVGVTAHEGLLMSTGNNINIKSIRPCQYLKLWKFVCTEFIKNASALKSFEKNWNQNVIKFLTVRKHPKNLTETLRKMRNFYFKRSSKLSAKEKIHRYTRLFSDLGTNLYVSHVAEKQRFLSPVHLYYYNRRNGPCASNFLAELKGDLPLGLETAWYHVKSFVNYYILGRKQECYGKHWDLTKAKAMRISINLMGFVAQASLTETTFSCSSQYSAQGFPRMQTIHTCRKCTNFPKIWSSSGSGLPQTSKY